MQGKVALEEHFLPRGFEDTIFSSIGWDPAEWRRVVELLVETGEVRDSVVIRVRKAYPGYFGTYDDIGVVRDWVDSLENLYPMGRNGTHRYNNMDHSMLSARAAVRAMSGAGTRSEIWTVNADGEHHESAPAAATGT